jgi:hypothetical protein
VSGLSDGGRSLGTDLGKRMFQHRQDVCDEIGAFEPAQRPYGEPHRLWVAAPKPSSDGREICGRRSTPILGNQDGQATCRNSDR